MKRFLLVVVVLAVAAGLYHSGRSERAIQAAVYVKTSGEHVKVSPLPRQETYSRSLWRGGVRSAEELIDVLDADPLLSDYYPSCRDSIEFFQMKQAVVLFTTFRIGDRIAWARKPIRVKEGEWLIRCGKVTLLARCLNRVSLTPQVPIDPIDTAQLEIPEAPFSFLPQPLTTEDPAVPPIQQPITTTTGVWFPPIVVGCCGGIVEPRVPIATPEPSVQTMLLAGLLGFSAVKFLGAVNARGSGGWKTKSRTGDLL